MGGMVWMKTRQTHVRTEHAVQRAFVFDLLLFQFTCVCVCAFVSGSIGIREKLDLGQKVHLPENELVFDKHVQTHRLWTVCCMSVVSTYMYRTVRSTFH